MKSWKQAKSFADKNSVIADDKEPRYLLEVTAETFEFTKRAWLKTYWKSQNQNELYYSRPKLKNTEKKASLRKTKMQKDWKPNADQNKFMTTAPDCEALISETTKPRKNIYGCA